jgi:hypothetical protein
MRFENVGQVGDCHRLAHFFGRIVSRRDGSLSHHSGNGKSRGILHLSHVAATAALMANDSANRRLRRVPVLGNHEEH